MHAMLSHYTLSLAVEEEEDVENKELEDECLETECRLLYQPPVALFTDINGLMTKYGSLCPK